MERVSRSAVKQERDRSKERSRSRGRERDRSRDRPANSRLADKRVYISNIPYETRWQDVKDLFRNEVGEVVYVELFVDENDKPRGCGIIELETPTIAKKAIEKMHRYEIGGRKIVVKEDYDVERDKTGRIVNQGGGGGRRDRERSRERDRDRDWDRRRDLSPALSASGGSSWKRGNTYGLSPEFLESLGIDGPLQSKVFVSNLDFRVDEKKLREVFRLAGRVMCVEVNKDKDGKSRGHGTVEYEHPVEAVQSISMFSNQELYERRMHVRMDRLPDPLTDLAKNRLPEGLKGIGMGLGMNGQPLVDVSRNLPSSNSNGNVASLLGSGFAGQAQTALTNAMAAATAAATAANPLSAMNLGGMNVGLASMLGQQGLDSLTSAANNAFGGGLSLGALANSANQLSAGGLSALSSLGSGGGLGLGGQANNLMQNPNAPVGAGGLSGVNMNQGFQNPGAGQAVGGQGQGGQVFRDSAEYGYSSSVYSTPSSNYNTAYQREKQYGNGVGASAGGVATGNANTSSNTVIISNLPASCTWQVLKTKFRECGEVVYAEIRDNKGIVRFASERDAERAVKVFDQSRVDGKTVMVRFL